MSSSGKLCHVALLRTDVSEGRNTSIIRVTRIGELGTTLVVISNRSKPSLGQRHNCSFQQTHQTHEQLLYPYQLQVQGLMPDDFPAWNNFCWCLAPQRAEHLFISSMFFTEYACFGTDDIINIHNQHRWAEYLQCVIYSRHQQQFSINVRAGTASECLPDLHVMFYHNDWQSTITEMSSYMIFQSYWRCTAGSQSRNVARHMHDGALAHCSHTMWDVSKTHVMTSEEVNEDSIHDLQAHQIRTHLIFILWEHL
jgi:hypothetical protein